MKFSQNLDGNGYMVTAYNAAGVSVNGKHFTQSLIISAGHLQQNWPLRSISQLNASHIDQLSETQPEMVILGTGNKLIFPAIEIYAALIQQNIGIEFMDTYAACRTYNILTGEGRNIVAGIIIE